MRSAKLCLLFLFFVSSLSIAKNQLFYYEPKVVELTGVIKRLTFPGPPNYESIESGDENETGRYLILKNPIDVDVVPGAVERGDNEQLEQNVKILHLIVDKDRYWKKLNNGTYVRIRGTLIHSFTGHHHTRVLLEAEKIEVLPRKKILAEGMAITQEDYESIDGDQNLGLTLDAKADN